MIDIAIKKSIAGFELQAEFTVPATGVTAIFGRSGAGKTSLVNSIAGLVRPDAGHIRIDDRVFFDHEAGINLPIEARGVGYVFQDSRLFPHLSVRGNLTYGRRRTRRPLRITDDAVIEVLGLAALLARKPHHLSGGERQRVALGRALLAQPRLLLLDEPLASLDAPRKAEVLPYIERLVEEFKLPALYVSHAIDELTRLADHVVIINDGLTVACGSLTEIMSKPEYAPLIGRFEAGAVLECTVHAHDPSFQMTNLAFADGYLQVPLIDLPPGTPIRARLRARDVAISLSNPNELSITNRLFGTVQSMTVREATYVDVAIALGHTTVRALITRESASRLKLAAGVKVWALIKAVALDSRAVGFNRRIRADDISVT
ncbi:MAG: molybdenum ABC transporter ATP-binding protein [Gammaproteobacteria bacterium]|nr:molybdenum ABC transporter ATP-binding protein [Gammaproteobacteria bacterium]